MNYGIVRIISREGVFVNDRKRPFVVIDPRAGRRRLRRDSGDITAVLRNAAAADGGPHLIDMAAEAKVFNF